MGAGPPKPLTTEQSPLIAGAGVAKGGGCLAFGFRYGAAVWSLLRPRTGITRAPGPGCSVACHLEPHNRYQGLALRVGVFGPALTTTATDREIRLACALTTPGGSAGGGLKGLPCRHARPAPNPCETPRPKSCGPPEFSSTLVTDNLRCSKTPPGLPKLGRRFCYAGVTLARLYPFPRATRRRQGCCI